VIRQKLYNGIVHLEGRHMKKLLLVVFLFCCSAPLAMSEGTNHETTAKLPNDRQIWPIPEIETSKEILSLESDFVEAKEILSVTQGNWRKVTYLVRYAVRKKDDRYPYDEIIFIAEDAWPAPGSNIKVKRLPWPFVKGSKFFYLKKDEKCNYKAYFDILTYS
jgi:hypothetical protein